MRLPNLIYSLMKIYRYQKFLEANVNIPLLDRGGNEGLLRGDALISKLESGDEIKLSNGTEVKIVRMLNAETGEFEEITDSKSMPLSQLTDEDGRYNSERASAYLKARFRYDKLFMDEDDNTYKLNDFYKDEAFGSAGPGKNTKENELVQMAVIYARMESESDFKEEDVSRVLKSIEEGNVPKNLKLPMLQHRLDIEGYTKSPIWMSTLINVPNKIMRHIKSDGNTIFDPAKEYVFYHASSTERSPLTEMKKANSRLNKGVNMNKYCPADMYAISTEGYDSLTEEISGADNLVTLGEILDRAFDERTFIPISLKKSGGGTMWWNNETRDFEEEEEFIIINNEAGSELPEFSVNQMAITKDPMKGIGSKIIIGSKWKSKGRSLVMDRNLTIDSPQTSNDVNVDGEVVGQSARHGKISHAWMRKFIEESEMWPEAKKLLERDPIQTFSELKELGMETLKRKVVELADAAKRLNNPRGIALDDSMRGQHLDLENKVISKIQSLQIIAALEAIDNIDPKQEEVDRIMTKVLLYAMSIKNDNVLTPRYVRVI